MAAPRPKSAAMQVSVIGLGKLGAPMAAVFAAKGHNVIGLDVNATFLAALKEGRAPVQEPRLQEMIDAGLSRLRVTSDYQELVAKSDVTFIIVPTPSDAQGAFSNDYVISAVKDLGAALRRKDGFHVIVVTSTVMPGSTDGPIREALERSSGRHVGSDVGLCYNPEFIALGSVVNNMLEPDFLLIGESDERSGALVASVYETVCPNHPPARRMNFVNAELTKISVNTFVTTKISYANMLADICDRLDGADVDVVTEAVGSDSRIGRKYLRGAIGYGGPCFPRDNIAFGTLASRLGANADIARATDTINRLQIDRLVAAVKLRVPKGAVVAVLGMSYKPDTSVIEESQGVMLARRLQGDGFKSVIHDPVATIAASRILGPDVSVASSIEDALKSADIAVVMTPWPEYARLSASVLPRRIPVIDCWRILKRDESGSIDVVWLGYGAQTGVSFEAAL
jgi:UDPglucose 6-dehydrogenase